MSVAVRPAVATDAEGICAAHQASVRGLCTADYSSAQIESWVGRLQPNGYVKSMADGEHMWVAEEGGRILGFTARLGSRIRSVYVRPEAARQGVGRRLLEAAEASARSEALERLHLDASLTAVPFYQQMGYRVQESRLHRLRDGTQIPAVAMDKPLTGTVRGERQAQVQ